MIPCYAGTHERAGVQKKVRARTDRDQLKKLML